MTAPVPFSVMAAALDTAAREALVRAGQYGPYDLNLREESRLRGWVIARVEAVMADAYKEIGGCCSGTDGDMCDRCALYERIDDALHSPSETRPLPPAAALATPCMWPYQARVVCPNAADYEDPAGYCRDHAERDGRP